MSEEQQVEVQAKPLNIYQRLNAIKKVVNYIQKDKKVDSYMVVTHDAVTAATRAAFVDNGVMVVPNELSSVSVDSGMVTGKGVPFIRFEAKYRVNFINIDEPTDLVFVELTAHALDQGDKAPGKAHSYVTKNAVLKILQMETGESDESRVEAQPKPETKKENAVVVENEESTGSFGPLTAKQQSIVLKTAAMVKKALTDDLPMDAYGLCEGSGFSMEEKIALWSCFDSKQKSLLKRMEDAERGTEPPKSRKETQHNLRTVPNGIPT